MRIGIVAALALSGVVLAAGVALADEAELPVIVDVAVSPHVRVGEVTAVRLAFRAPLANVATVVEATEDLDGPAASRSTRQRAIGVTARAYGYETGDLVLSLAFATAGLKRVTLTLVTDQGESSEAAVVEIEVRP